VDSRSVLLVEDDPALTTLVADVLSGAGYHPVTIANHSEIEAAVDRWQPRCVILDGEVPATGESRTWDDAAAIRRAHPSLPVVIFTADGASLAEARAATSPRSRAAGFVGIISKPFVVDEFLATVRSAVERPVPAMASVVPQEPHATTLPIGVFPDVGRLAPDWPQTDLLRTVVHELRTPLTVIRGQMQLARRRIGRDPERERVALDLALAQVDRMALLIGDLLDHASLSSNSLSLTVVPVDLVTAVAVAVSIHDYAPTPRITFAHPYNSVRVLGDPARIAQILDNLIGNALKYSAENAPVAISVARTETAVELRVVDRGLGVPAAEADKIFDPFYRTSLTRHIRGTGLGLYISRRLAERHGGSLRLEATSSAGSTFVLTLPASPPS
jgi:signal transduction histidine kinase